MISMTKDYTPALILASSSPRRRELLRLLSSDFLVVPPEVEEAEAQTPEDLLGIAQAKAAAVAQKFPKSIVIAADTGVFRDGKSFGKPRDLEEAKRFLSALSGGWHSVFTALVVQRGESARKILVETRVLFRSTFRGGNRLVFGSGGCFGQSRRLCHSGPGRRVCGAH